MAGKKEELYLELLQHGIEHNASCLREKVLEVIAEIKATLKP